MPRFAAIDIGTNSVLLLVAERTAAGFEAVLERAEITRLGRGVDQTLQLSPEGMEATLAVLERYAQEARDAGAQGLVVSATSAARDAQNGAEFLAAAKSRARVLVEILPGELEAELSYAAVASDPQVASPGEPLWVIDIGGGSTELIFGQGEKPRFRQSFNIGSVRLTERLVRHDPPTSEELAQMATLVQETFSVLPRPVPAGEGKLVGVAGTITTLFALQHRMADYDSKRVHGGRLSKSDLEALAAQLASLTTAERAKLPGLQPKRADVICAGAQILLGALQQLGLSEVGVSDRGLRWGFLAQRFGNE